MVSHLVEKSRKIYKCPNQYIIMELDKWQQEILDEQGHLVLCTGRQVGKTTIFAQKAAKYMIENPNSRIIVVSLTEDQAQLMIVMTLDYLQRNNKKDISTGQRKPTKNKIQLKNKSQILARPVGNTGDAVRGFTGDVLIVDEASRMPEFMWTAAKPTLLTTAGKIWMCSTPFGKQGYFYKCYLNKHDRYKVIKVNSWDVVHERKISDSWTKERREAVIEGMKEEKAEMSALEWQQEYMGEFIEDLRQMFSDELIRSCQTQIRRNMIVKGRNYFLGVDIARMGEDESTFEAIDKLSKDNLVHVESQITTKTLLTQTATHILGLNNNYDFRKIGIDNEGIGVGVFDMLITDDKTRRKVIGLRNSKKLYDYKDQKKERMQKVDLYMNLLKLMEKRQLHLLNDNEVFQSFKSIQYEYTKDKKGKTFLHIFGNNSHIVEGLMRACWLAKDKSLKLWVDYI